MLQTTTIDRFAGEYRFLSNFWPAEVEFERVRYASVEHAYQAAKTFDRIEKQMIAEARTAGEAKRMSRKITIREDWEAVRVGIMTELVRAKFTNHAELREMLLATGEAELVEGNTWGDRFWGVCRGEGENTLGRILMQVRKELAGE